MKAPVTPAALAIAFVLIACGGNDTDDEQTQTPAATESPAEIPVVDITKTDQAFDAPGTIPGGLTHIRFHNESTRGHGLDLLRLSEGSTIEQLEAAIVLSASDFVTSKNQWTSLTDSVASIATTPPGGTSEVVFDLEPGSYVLVSFIIGDPFTRPLAVTAAPAAQPAPPEAQSTITMSDFAYAGAPGTLPPGRTTLEVVNEGHQPHAMLAWRVNEEGITTGQVSQHLTGTPVSMKPTYAPTGGMGEIDPGVSGWVTLDLEPGVYTLVCLVIDNGTGSGETGKLHYQLGMNHPFTVQ